MLISSNFILHQFVFEASYGLIDEVFNGLDDLHWKNPLRLTSSQIIGQLLTNEGDMHHYCGHALSTDELKKAVYAAMSADVIEVHFAQFMTLLSFIESYMILC